jgi:hypothetical protein
LPGSRSIGQRVGIEEREKEREREGREEKRGGEGGGRERRKKGERIRVIERGRKKKEG